MNIRDLVERAIPISALALLFVLGFVTLKPFLPAILWGIVLSVCLRPFHDRLKTRFKRRPLVPTLISASLMTLVLVLPIIGLARAIVAFVPEFLLWISEARIPLMSPDDFDSVSGDPVTGEWKILWNELLADLQSIRLELGVEFRPLLSWLVAEGRLIGVFVLEFALGVLIATVLLHRARPISAGLRQIAERVGGAFAGEMIDRAVVTTRSTVFGVLGSAAVQTAVATFAYILVDAPHWPILALVTFLLALIQIGPVLVWLPLAIWLWSLDQPGAALFMGLWGTIAVGFSDNIVRTHVVSKGGELPAILAFLGAIGGLIAWGIIGIVLGPVVIAVCYQLVLRWVTMDAAA